MLSRRAFRVAAMLLATLCLALGFGLNYGKSNQTVYLLAPVQKLQPELWTRDWFLNHCSQYHVFYTELSALLLRIDGSGFIIGLANVACGLLCFWLIYRLLRVLTGQDVFAELMLLLAMAAASSTAGPGSSYVLIDIFQASTVATAGLLAASLAYVQGRALVAGLWLALAGAFHLNFLLLDACVFALAWLVGGERKLRDALLLLGPSLPVLLWSLPFLLASTSYAGLDQATLIEARRLFQDVRTPHHYHVRNFILDFIPWLGFELLGAAALWQGAKAGLQPQRRLLALLAGFVMLIVPAVLLSAVPLRSVTQLFAWRISAHGGLLAQAALAVGLVRALSDSELSWAGLGRVERWFGAVGLACLVLGAALGRFRGVDILTTVVALLAVVALRSRTSPAAGPPKPWLRPGLELALCLTFVVAQLPHLLDLNRKSDLLGDRDRDRDALCGWLQSSTPKQAMLLAPPDEGDLIRFHCQRAVVVDWKGQPTLPKEIMQWSERMQDVTGRRPLTSRDDLAGYQTMDRSRLDLLLDRYQFDVLVIKQGAALRLDRAPDFTHGRFTAYLMR